MEQKRHIKGWRISLICSGWKFPVILWLFCLTVANLTAQITSPSSSLSRTAHYPNHPDRTDPIYIYCVTNTDGEITGSLSASHPEDAVSDFDFEWRKYNPSIPGFDPVLKMDTQVKTSTVTGLESGGYQVNITNGASNDTILVAWIFINKPLVSAEIQNFTCDYLAMNGDTLAQLFTYYDPEDHSDATLPNGINFAWSSIPPSSIPYPTLELNPITWNPPYEDTDYYLTVTDWLTCQNEDSFFYHSIHVKPDFTPEPAQGEAPLEVNFTNTSLNAVTFEWSFGDDSTSILEIPPTHTYYYPDEYEVKLIARSAEGCEDSLKFQYIIVDPSGLDIPNVFTPNDDEWNDRFVVASQSLRTIYVQIFSRTGKKVYEFSGQGTRLQEWKGWDGKINGGADASPGVYFYIIRAVGWDDIEYKGKLYRGTVYLIREK
jgi:gliding motility-associated-like protein